MKPDHPSDAEPDPIPGSDLLWRLGRHVELAPSAEGWPDDATLTAYRQGLLASDEAERVESILAADGGARQRLAELAGQGAAKPPAAVRERVLTAFDRSFEATTADNVLAWPRRRIARLGGGLALAAAMILAAALWLSPGGAVAPLPPDVGWAVTAYGVADMRGSDSAEPSWVRVTPTTRLRIDVTPDRAVRDVEIGLYRRLEDGRVDGIGLDPEVIEQVRGAVVVEVTAGEVLGRQPGRHHLVVVVATPGGLPSLDAVQQALAAGEPTDPSWRFHTVDVEVITHP